MIKICAIENVDIVVVFAVVVYVVVVVVIAWVITLGELDAECEDDK